MPLTSAQRASLKTAALADGNISAAANANNDQAVADYYNASSSPNVDIWRPAVPIDEIVRVIDWTEYAAMVVAKQNSFIALTQGSVIDATQATVRAAFGSIFSGATNTIAALTAVAKRPASKLEALAAFITVAGTANNSAVFGTVITAAEISTVLRG